MAHTTTQLTRLGDLVDSIDFKPSDEYFDDALEPTPEVDANEDVEDAEENDPTPRSNPPRH